MATYHCLTSNDTTILKTNNYDSELSSAKLETFYQEQIASPNSTEYTDDLSEAPMEIHRCNSDSSRFYEVISSFEPIIELSHQIDYNFKIAFTNEFILQNEFKAENPVILETPQSADHSSHEETSSMNEEVEEDGSETYEGKKWNEKKDKILKSLAAKCKYDWKKIAKKFNANENTEMTPADLKQKYKELTKVSIPLRVKFTHQEDLMIAKYFNIYGCDWTQIATHFTDRTAMMLKNRYYSHIRKKNLLSTMLEEAQGTLSPKKEKETIPTIDSSQKEKIENNDYSSEDEFCFSPNKFPIFRLNSAFYEFEDPFNNVLHERITISNF